MELVDFELAFKEAVSAHKKVGWVSVFDKTIHFFKSFIFKAKAFSFCLFYCTLHRHSERSEESSYIQTLSKVRVYWFISSAFISYFGQ